MELYRRAKEFCGRLLEIPEEGAPPERYRILLWNIRVLMLLASIVPLALMAFINYHQYQSALKDEIVSPLKILVNKTKHSFELFLAGRVSTVRFIASEYSYEQLADPRQLNRIFRTLKKEFEGFVDIGLIDCAGELVSYAGPYDLKGKNYSDQSWFQQVKVSGVYISDVFMGYRKFPHVIIAVQHADDTGRAWMVRATIDTARFDELIASMGLDAQSDAFLMNGEGVLQTKSKHYGGVLDVCAVPVPPVSHEPSVEERKDPKGRDVMVAYAYLGPSYDFVLMAVKPKAQVLKAWYTLKSELLILFVGGVLIIVVVVWKLTTILVQRMQQSDDRRELALRQMQHSHKLSSIGRLAAGVAHEINNPLAVINEKAGLMKDMIEFTPEFPTKEKFLGPINTIVGSVERCRVITHRLLGFARRMDVEIEILDVNEVIREVMGFLEKEAAHRNLQVKLSLAHDLPRIPSDRGQLQQVFLNILTNAFAAVEDGGSVAISTWEKDLDTVGVVFQDNGCGMSEETLKRIYEPFFTTKKGHGTGLGLSITYGLVKRLGGDIDVQSQTGQGTRFVVYLPKKPREQAG